MATQTFSTSPSNSSNAYFRDWGKKLSDAMETVGFTKTADTGQIDWTTVLAPGAALTIMGYEIRAFSDALQASNPVVVKIEYGSGSSNASNVAINVTVGRASDGAGTLVGEISSTFAIKCANTSTTAYDCYVSGASDRIGFAMFSNATYLLSLYIERTKSSAGANTVAGVNIVGTVASSNYQQYFAKKGLGNPFTIATPGICCLAPYSGTAVNGSDIGLFPIFPLLGYADNPDLGACVYFTADIAAATSVALTILGASHTYITVAGSIGTINGNTSAKSLAVRYE